MNRLSEEDESALSDFLEQVSFEDVSFQAWRGVHRALDIVLDLYLSEEERLLGGRQEVSYLRQKGSLREPLTVCVSLERDMPWGSMFEFPNHGDIKGKKKGKLRIVLKEKK